VRYAGAAWTDRGLRLDDLVAARKALGKAQMLRLGFGLEPRELLVGEEGASSLAGESHIVGEVLQIEGQLFGQDRRHSL
jgi:hypothetical protein